jgi:Ca2+-binding RTX toxin-like protein
MKKVIHSKSRSAPPLRVPISAIALAVALAVAGAAGIVAAQATAANQGPVKAKLAHGVLSINGDKANNTIALRLAAGATGVLEVDVGDDGSADFTFERDQITRIVVDGRSGDDLLRNDDRNGTFTDAIPTTIQGGDGNDTIAGGRGNETLLGGRGNDTIDGNGGNDLSLLGAGDDTFVWDPGDGSDSIEGQSGSDTMLFNGANLGEKIELSANGNRLKFVRDLANITMDTHGVERVDFNALGGTDLVTVNDLTGTDVDDVNIDLAGTLGGATGDGQADHVIVNGTNGDDTIDVSGDQDVVKVSGLAPTIEVLHPEVANDRLDIDTLAGADTVSTLGLAAGAIQLFVDGVLNP